MSETFAKVPLEEETLELIVERIRCDKATRRRVLTIRQDEHLANFSIEQFRAALAQHGEPEARFIRDGKVYASEEDGEDLLEILNEDLNKGQISGRKLVSTRKHVKK